MTGNNYLGRSKSCIMDTKAPIFFEANWGGPFLAEPNIVFGGNEL